MRSRAMARGPPRLLALGLLLLLPFLPKLAFAQTRAMCVAQFALANQACAALPVGTYHVSSLQHDESGGGEDADEEPNHRDEHRHHHKRGQEQEHEHEHEQEHEHEREQGHGHGHRHRDRDRDGNGDGDGGNGIDSPNIDCCRWLKEVDTSCVCEALLHLPVFLIKPQHTYTVSVGSACRFHYVCGGV